MVHNSDDMVGVRFVEAGAISYCRAGDLSLGVGDYVVVRMDRGERLGWVVIAPDQVLASEHTGPMRVVDRIATEKDVEAWEENRRRAKEDIPRAQEVATRKDPRIRVANLEYDLAGERADVAFVASERIQHGELREQLSEVLGVRIHLDQVGDRDRAKALGGLGVCGRALCCSTWQTEFPVISIKMAKDQDLSPNPSKISGVCGRLLCCLSFEVEAYRELRGDLPKVGKRVTTPAGRARILSVNALRQVVRMRLDESGEVVEIPADELRAQYGTAVRPEELEEEIESPVRREDLDRKDSALATLTPVDARSNQTNTGGDRSPDNGGSDQKRKRRRRGRRGGRRRGGGSASNTGKDS